MPSYSGIVTSSQGTRTLDVTPRDVITFTPTSGTYTVEYPIGTVAINAATTTQNITANSSATQVRITCSSGSVAYVNVDYLEGGPLSSAALAAVQTAFDASGGVAGASTPYLGPVATRTNVPNVQQGTNVQGMCRTIHYARDNIAALQVAYANWWYAFQVESTGGGTADFRVSIEYPLGSTPQRFLFGGATTGTAANGATIFTDMLTLTTAIPNGAAFALNVWQNNSVKLISFTTAAYLPGERGAYGVTTPDLTATGGAAFGTASTGASIPPVAILGMTSKPTAALIGDSIQLGAIQLVNTNFAGNGLGDQGLNAKSLGPAMAYLNLGSYGDRANVFVAAGTRRRAIANYASHIVCNYGTNDIYASLDTAATLATNLTAIAALFPNKPFWQNTICPRTTSSDSFATVGNQTVAAGESERLSFNNTLRGGVTWAAGMFDTAAACESGYLSGFWKAPGWTADGTHPSVLAQVLIQASGAVNPAMLTR